MLSKEPWLAGLSAAGPELRLRPPVRGMTLLVTGSTGVLGRAFRPLAESAGHTLRHPDRSELDLFDATAVRAALRGVCAREASAILVDAALASGSRPSVRLCTLPTPAAHSSPR